MDKVQILTFDEQGLPLSNYSVPVSAELPQVGDWLFFFDSEHNRSSRRQVVRRTFSYGLYSVPHVYGVYLICGPSLEDQGK